MKQSQPGPESLVRPEKFGEDEKNITLRPLFLYDFIGQQTIKDNLAMYIEAAKRRKEPLDHLFLIGPPGLGKTTLAQIVARELGVDFKITSAPALEKPKDLSGFLSTNSDRTVFFIDEIHRLKPVIEEKLYPAMEEFTLDITLGEGMGARTVRIPVPRFTLVGATTRAGMVSKPLRDRFGIHLRFDFYQQEELCAIVERSSHLLGAQVDRDAAMQIASCSRGTPRIANRILRRMCDFALIESQGRITLPVVQGGLKRLEIDSLGLEKYDREILRSIIENFSGGPVGAETLAISIGESLDTLEDYYEPFLIQSGLLQRTPRGRVVTQKAYSHLGLPARSKDAEERLLF